MRIVVAMSGGVDSSVVAGLLKEQGHEVIGLAMKTHSLEPKANRACCTPDDMRDARLVADILGIPFYVLPYEDMFLEHVIMPFAKAYRDGYTPNPCVECNDKVKFQPLVERARLLGAEQLATGHYARIDQAERGPMLRRGVDENKDQTYFLYRLTQEQLGFLSFPLGDMVKDEVREHARRLGLPLADKHESQEICFVGREGYAATVEKVLGEGGKPGRFVDSSGRKLGDHSGIHKFTLGQRRGLGLSAKHPLYVIHIDPMTGDVVVGPSRELEADGIVIENLVWVEGEPEIGREVLVQQRYRGKPIRAVVESHDATHTRMKFVDPGEPGAPGQAAVIYDGDWVLGGGSIGRDVRHTHGHSGLPIVSARIGGPL
jgi:tRNA-specific 2-thiouridylase